jgi:hypothetical protein
VPHPLIPAIAGIQSFQNARFFIAAFWVPAFAGTSGLLDRFDAIGLLINSDMIKP